MIKVSNANEDSCDRLSPSHDKGRKRRGKRDKQNNQTKFLSECERLGIPEDAMKYAHDNSVAIGQKWWSKIQEGLPLPSSLPSNTTKNCHLAVDPSSVADYRVNAATSIINSPTGSGYNTQDFASVAKSEILWALQHSGGDTLDPRFQDALQGLSRMYKNNNSSSNNIDKERGGACLFDGQWDTISRPTFKECIGVNENGDFEYTLGRMSFDMFRPSNLICSVQRIVSKSERMKMNGDNYPAEVPSKLKEEIDEMKQKKGLRTYDIEIHFTIEPRRSSTQGCIKEPNSSKSDISSKEGCCRAPSKPIEAIMTNSGYALPDPTNPSRYTVWFTGGVLTPANNQGNNDSLPHSSCGDYHSNPPRKTTSTQSQQTTKSATQQLSQKIFSAAWAVNCNSNNSRKTNSCNHGASTGYSSFCPLNLLECKQISNHCCLHGVSEQMSWEKNRALKRKAPRYYRPKYGPGRRAGLIGNIFSVGEMEEPYSSEWEDIFAPCDNWKRTIGESAKALAAKILLGAEVPDRMEDDGTMSFKLNRPIGGHGVTYVDILYLDQDMRILRGNAGGLFVQVQNRRDTGKVGLLLPQDDQMLVNVPPAIPLTSPIPTASSPQSTMPETGMQLSRIQSVRGDLSCLVEAC